MCVSLCMELANFAEGAFAKLNYAKLIPCRISKRYENDSICGLPPMHSLAGQYC